MIIKNIRYAEASEGESINSFSYKIVNYRQMGPEIIDVIGNFNGLYFEVKEDTTPNNIIKEYSIKYIR